MENWRLRYYFLTHKLVLHDVSPVAPPNPPGCWNGSLERWRAHHWKNPSPPRPTPLMDFSIDVEHLRTVAQEGHFARFEPESSPAEDLLYLNKMIGSPYCEILVVFEEYVVLERWLKETPAYGTPLNQRNQHGWDMVVKRVLAGQPTIWTSDKDAYYFSAEGTYATSLDNTLKLREWVRCAATEDDNEDPPPVPFVCKSALQISLSPDDGLHVHVDSTKPSMGIHAFWIDHSSFWAIINSASDSNLSGHSALPFIMNPPIVREIMATLSTHASLSFRFCPAFAHLMPSVNHSADHEDGDKDADEESNTPYAEKIYQLALNYKTFGPIPRIIGTVADRALYEKWRRLESLKMDTSRPWVVRDSQNRRERRTLSSRTAIPYTTPEWVFFTSVVNAGDVTIVGPESIHSTFSWIGHLVLSPDR
ncbi:hypothetical protein B0H19DRAFT_1237800 [Mycena capillaripes]|nr:hypothetical protein B0H19DRAFT_1237800 [Mycena capillaripes]